MYADQDVAANNKQLISCVGVLFFFLADFCSVMLV